MRNIKKPQPAQIREEEKLDEEEDSQSFTTLTETEQVK